MHCAALNCDVKTRQGISLFSFPDNEERRTVWIKNLKGGHDFELPEPARICANHFDDSQFVVNPQIAASVGFRQRSLRLKDDAIPTIFDHNYPVNPSAGKRKRKFRVRKAKLKRKKKEDWSSETDTCIEDSDSSDLYNPDDDEDFNTKMKCTGNKLDKIKVNKSSCPTESLGLQSDEDQVLAGDCKLGQYLGHKRQEEVDDNSTRKHQMLKAKDGHTNVYNSLLVKKTVESPSTQKTSGHSTDRDTHNGSTNLVKPNSLNGSQQFGIPAQLPVFVQTNNTGTPQSVQKVSQLQLIGAPAQKVPQLQLTGSSQPAQKVLQLQHTGVPAQKVPQLQLNCAPQQVQKVPQLQSTGAPAQKVPLQLRLVIENNPQLQTPAQSSEVPALQPNTGTTPQSDSLTTLQSSIEMPLHIASGITQQSSIGTSPHSSTGTCNTPVDTVQERNIYFDKAQVQTRNTTRAQQKDAGCVLMFSKIPTFLNKFSDALFSLQQAGMLCDVELKGKDSSVYAHRLILFASGSSRLKSMLSDIQHWKYSCITLDLSTFSSSILQSLVRYFYTGEVVIARKEVIDLWRLCEWLSLYDICKSLHPYCFFEIAGQVSTIRKPMNNAEQSSLDKKRVKTNKTLNNKTYKKDGVNHLLIKDALPEVLAEEKTPETCQDKKLSEKLKDIIKKNEELLQEMSSRSQNTFIMSKEQIMTHVRANSNASKNLKKRFGPVNDENFMKKTTESVRYQVQTIDNEMYMNSDIQARTVSGETSSVVESNVVTSGVEASNVVASTVAEQTYTMPNYEDTMSELHRKTMDELGLSENSLTNIKTEPDYFMDEISSEMGLLTSLKTEDGVEYKIFENSDIQDESDTAEMQTHTAVTENNVENIPLENVVIKSEPLWE